MLILIVLVVTAVCFDFTNGFHDTANAVATSIATGALKPRVAVMMSAVLNLVGAFLSIKVAATIAKGIVNPHSLTKGSGLTLVFAALVGAILWNLITWYFTLPSSSSHALIGGIIGATIVAGGAHDVSFHGIAKSVITLALIAHGDISASHFYVPLWVKLACACAIALGTAIGGWRIINTMGNRITEVESPQGFSAESASAAVILSSSFYGYPLSTTHVVSGGVMGAGAGKRLESVHWSVAGQMVSAWVLTIPMAGVFGAVAWEIANLLGANAGTVLTAVLTALAAAALFTLAQRNRIGAADLDRTHVSPEREAEIAAGAAPAPAAPAAA